MNTPSDRTVREQLQQLSAEDLAQHQLAKFNRLIERILPDSRFYADKLADLQGPLESLEDLADLPFTYKAELASARHEDDLVGNLTWPIEKYVRFHRTSGTSGRPMVVLDTLEDWQWWLDSWQFVLDAAEIETNDRAMLAFSFGPFIGFWSAHDALVQRGALVIPSGGMNTASRLDLMCSTQATVLFCTPTYALHLIESAAASQIDTRQLHIRKVVVAGEPGGSTPAIRQRIEEGFNARVIDHAGASEVGPWGYADPQKRGLYVNESEFIAEFLSVENGESAGEGELSELVITTLGREGCPVIRYRTGDLVRPSWNADGPCNFVLLEGGVLSRVDDMMVIRGVNIFPSSIEQILRSFPEVVEYRMVARKRGEMDDLEVEIEDRLGDEKRVAKELQLRLGLRVDVACVELGSLPRFEGKGKRFVDER